MFMIANYSTGARYALAFRYVVFAYRHSVQQNCGSLDNTSLCFSVSTIPMFLQNRLERVAHVDFTAIYRFFVRAQRKYLELTSIPFFEYCVANVQYSDFSETDIVLCSKGGLGEKNAPSSKIG